MLLIVEVVWPYKIPWRSKKRYINWKTSTTFLPPKKCLDYAKRQTYQNTRKQ